MACAAVFGLAQAAEITEILTVDNFGIEKQTTYTDVSYTSTLTGITYAGNMAKANAANGAGMQFRTSKNKEAGLVATANPNNYKIISVKVSPSTEASTTNQWDVYGNASAYTNFKDLYSDDTKGLLIGSGTTEATVTATEDLFFFGFRGNKNAIYINQIEIVYSDGSGAPDTRLEAGLEFSATEATATMGEAFTAPTLTFATNAPITYTSSNEKVATVDAATGAVTPVGVGSTNITATAEANDEYKAGEASYTLTVEKALPKNIIYRSEMGEDFTFETAEDDFEAWTHDTRYGLKGSAYVKGTIYATVSYAVSPVIDLTEIPEAKLLFSNAFNQYKINNQSIDVSLLPQYAEIVIREEGSTEWKLLASPTVPESFSWTFFDNGEISLAEYADKKVQFGYKYISTEECAGTWEIKDIFVTGVKVPVPTPEKPVITFADNTVTIAAAENCNIFYTTDGSEPTVESTPYSAPFEITETVTVKAIAVFKNKVSEVAEALCEYVAPKDAELSFAEESVTYVVGEEYFIGDLIPLVELTKATTAEVTYTSSNEEVVSYIAAEGMLKINGIGEAVITASAEANDEYLAGTASYTIIINELPKPQPDAIYQGLIESAEATEWEISSGSLSSDIWQWDEANGFMATSAQNENIIVSANLTSPLINIEGYKELALSFEQYTENFGSENPADFCKVLISVDGAEFTEIAPVTAAAEGWTLTSADLADVKGSTLQVRFKYTATPECVGVWKVKNLNVTGFKDAQGIESVETTDALEAVYYNLQGVRVANPANGIYIKVQGNKTSKVYIK